MHDLARAAARLLVLVLLLGYAGLGWGRHPRCACATLTWPDGLSTCGRPSPMSTDNDLRHNAAVRHVKLSGRRPQALGLWFRFGAGLCDVPSPGSVPQPTPRSQLHLNRPEAGMSGPNVKTGSTQTTSLAGWRARRDLPEF